MILSYLSLLGAISMGVVGQIEMKMGSMQAAEASKSAFLQMHTLIGIFFYTSSVFFYIYALKKIPLTFALPSGAVSFVVGAYLAHLIWNEPFGMAQIVSLILILTGVCILAYYT